MVTRISIGDFAKMTHLSVKALRHYHDVGLLAPAQIDISSGYRFYAPGQVATAQVIRRFRDLGMRLEDIRSMLTAPDVAGRNEVIVAHLERMESQLATTRAAVASLRALLERPRQPIEVEYRLLAPVVALTITERVAVDDLDEWWGAAFGELLAAVSAGGTRAPAPPAALYPPELFEAEVGDITALVPAPAGVAVNGRLTLTEIPGGEFAVTVHRGPFGDLDQAYGALGTYVTEREIGLNGPIREYYIVSPFDTPDETAHVTEVCWPVFRTTPGD